MRKQFSFFSSSIRSIVRSSSIGSGFVNIRSFHVIFSG